MASNTPFSSTLRSFTFMDFAGEIRNQIYRECLLVDRWILASKPCSWGLTPTILRLNSQIYREAFPVLWSENHWVNVKGDDHLMKILEEGQLNYRTTPQQPSPSKLVFCPVITLKIDFPLQGSLPSNYSMLRLTRLVHLFELPALSRTLVDLRARNESDIKACAFIDNRKPNATRLIKQLVNWTLFNTAKYDWRLGYQVINPRTQISLFGAGDEVIHPNQGERLDLPWYHGENITATARIWLHRLQQAQGDWWLQRCIYLDHYALVAKITSLPWFILEYGPPKRVQWQRHLVSLGHNVAHLSLQLKDTQYASSFLATIWQWNILKLDGTWDLKNHMAETHYLMFKSLNKQGRHFASVVHLVQAISLHPDHPGATAAANSLLRYRSLVSSEEHDCFFHNLRNVLDPIMWGLPVDRSLLLKKGDKTLHFIAFRFPKAWTIHWDWATEMTVPFVHLWIEYPQHPPS